MLQSPICGTVPPLIQTRNLCAYAQERAVATIHTSRLRHYNVLVAAPPVLRIAPGDTVITTTVDAHGFDAAQPGDSRPATRMIACFVEGAEPGDTLVVHLRRYHAQTAATVGAG